MSISTITVEVEGHLPDAQSSGHSLASFSISLLSSYHHQRSSKLGSQLLLRLPPSVASRCAASVRWGSVQANRWIISTLWKSSTSSLWMPALGALWIVGRLFMSRGMAPGQPSNCSQIRRMPHSHLTTGKHATELSKTRTYRTNGYPLISLYCSQRQ